MTDELSEGGWPFGTESRPASGLFDTDPARLSIVTAAATALDLDPLELPALYDRIDSDYVESLCAENSSDSPEGVRSAIEVSWEDVSVLLRDDESIEVYSNGKGPDGLAPSATVEHDWSSADPLHWSIGRAIGDASEGSPSSTVTRLIERIDADAIDRLLRPPMEGTERSDSRLLLSVDGYEIAVDPGGTVSIEPSLSVLKRSGAAVLVVGSIPEPSFDRASATLFGDRAAGCSPVFALHGRDAETARRRLSMAGLSTSRGVVLEHETTARSASVSASEAEPSNGRELEVRPVSGGLERLTEAVRDRIRDSPADPSDELRICVDSLSSMIDSNDLETVRDGVESLCRVVRESHGVGHFILPVDADGDEVETLLPSFDALVELRTGEVGLEQRWLLTATGYETSWFPLYDD